RDESGGAREHPGDAQERAGEVLRRRHHAQAQAAGEAEGRQAPHEARRPRGDSAGSVSRGAEGQRRAGLGLARLTSDTPPHLTASRRVGLVTRQSKPAFAAALTNRHWREPSIRDWRRYRREFQSQPAPRQDEHPCWRKAATWKASVSSDATFNTSGSAACGIAPSKARSISSKDMPPAKHSRMSETDSRVPRIASFPPRSLASATIHA